MLFFKSEFLAELYIWTILWVVTMLLPRMQGKAALIIVPMAELLKKLSNGIK